MPFGFKDCGTFFTFSNQNGLTAFTFSFHLLLHGILNRCRRNDIFKLHTVNLNTPRVCCHIQCRTHLCINNLSGSQRFIKFQFTDNVSQRCGCQIFNGHNRILNTVAVKLRICDLIKYDRIDPHCNIILCDYRLRCKIHNLFLQYHLFGNLVDNRHLQVKSDGPCALVSTETFNDICVGLRYDFNAGCQKQ